MPTKTSLKIVKVPNAKTNAPVATLGFARMPKLYLELFENKSKIKQDLVNKEHNHHIESSKDKKIEDRDGSKSSDSEGENYTPEKTVELKNKDSREKDREDLREKDSREKESREKDSREKESREKDREDLREKESREKDREDSREKESREKDREDSREKDREDSREKDREDSRDDESEDVADRLKELLREESPVDTNKRHRHSSPDNSPTKEIKEQYNRDRDRTSDQPPSLADLEASGKYTQKKVLRNADQKERTTQEEYDLKRELLFKIEILKKTYKNAVIPEVSIHSDYNTIKDMYDSALRSLSLDSTVKKYKTYLIGGCGVLEFILGNFLHFDMNGFTTQQIVNMESYEQLLIELGEKSYISGKSNWPVEVRLALILVMNTAFFLLSKMIMKKSGSNILGMMNNMNVSQPAPMPVKKRHMRGPNVDPNDLPDVENGNDA